MRFLNSSKTLKTKMITVQNPYSLLNRQFEVGSSEICHREGIKLLAYSPLGFGVLSGKYLNNKKPKNSRLVLFPNFKRYSSPQSIAATERYSKLASDIGISTTQMALSFVNDRSFVCSNIIGATNMNQLKENINSFKISLSKSILNEIEKIHNEIPDPAP